MTALFHAEGVADHGALRTTLRLQPCPWCVYGYATTSTGPGLFVLTVWHQPTCPTVTTPPKETTP